MPGATSGTACARRTSDAGHKGNERIVDMLEELHRTLFAEDDVSWRGKRATKRFNLIQAFWEDVEEGDRETGWIEWQFTPDARRLQARKQDLADLLWDEQARDGGRG